MAQLDNNGLSAYTDKSSWGNRYNLYPVGCWARYAHPGGTYIMLWGPEDGRCLTAFVGPSSYTLDGGFIRVK